MLHKFIFLVYIFYVVFYNISVLIKEVRKIMRKNRSSTKKERSIFMQRSRQQHCGYPNGYYSYGIDENMISKIMHMIAQGIDHRIIANHFGITMEDVQLIIAEHLVS